MYPDALKSLELECEALSRDARRLSTRSARSVKSQRQEQRLRAGRASLTANWSRRRKLSDRVTAFYGLEGAINIHVALGEIS